VLWLKKESKFIKSLKNTPRTLFPYTAEEKIVKAGKKYFDEQAKKISGFNKSLYNDIDSINNRIYKLKGIILDEKWSIKNAKKIAKQKYANPKSDTSSSIVLLAYC
jgi:hypothetical protein